VHYSRTISEQWLLIAGYRHLQMSISNVFIADPPFPSKQWYWTDPSFTFTGLQTEAYSRSLLATAGLLVMSCHHCHVQKANCA